MLLRVIKNLIKLLTREDDHYQYLGDIEELYYTTCKYEGKTWGNIYIVKQFLKSIPEYLNVSIYWGGAMLKNYFTISMRNLLRNKGFSFINIFGLAVGLASCLLIMLYVVDETSYDKFYKNSDRIYRIASHSVLNNNVENTARSGAPIATTLKDEFPEVEAVTRFRNYGFPVFRYGEKAFSEERVLSVDSTFFEVFNLNFIAGDKRNVLSQPNNMVITESMAKKYFGNENPIGKIINSDNRNDYNITAVVEDVPRNSHFHFDFLQSIARYNDSNSPVWFFNDFYTYALLKEGTSTKLLEEKFLASAKVHIDPLVRQFLGISIDDFFASGGEFSYSFQPLTDIHLYSNRDFEIEPNSDASYIYIFSSIALAILLIACMNFINLSTARSSARAKEVGIRKTIGSLRKQLINQFISESVVISFIAMMLGVGIIYFVLPYFNSLAQKELVLFEAGNLYLIPLLIILSAAIGTLAGSYPAWILSSFKPAVVLKSGGSKTLGRQSLRGILVVVQFAISIVLIIGTFVILKQISFIKNTNLGFNKEQVVVINKCDDLGAQLSAFKLELQALPGIMSVSNSSELIGNNLQVAGLTSSELSSQEAQLLVYLMTDSNFIETYSIKLQEGRFFESDHSAAMDKIVINESAAKIFGFDQPVGKVLVNTINNEMKLEVMGVVADFHFESLHRKIKPMVFLPLMENNRGKYISVRIKPQNTSASLESIKNTWQKFAGNQPFEYKFFDEHFERVYLAEQRTSQIFASFSIIGIIIACMGLLGLSVFIISLRTKEVGIRKSLGASTTNVLFLLNKQFIKWILIANLIALPIGYLLMETWLQDFAYRTNISIWVLAVSGFLSFLFALATVSYYSIKASLANPVDSIKYE